MYGFVGFLEALVIALAIMLILREFWCWYWKINHRIEKEKNIDEKMDRINDNLNKLILILSQNKEENNNTLKSRKGETQKSDSINHFNTMMSASFDREEYFEKMNHCESARAILKYMGDNTEQITFSNDVVEKVKQITNEEVEYGNRKQKCIDYLKKVIFVSNDELQKDLIETDQILEDISQRESARDIYLYFQTSKKYSLSLFPDEILNELKKLLEIERVYGTNKKDKCYEIIKEYLFSLSSKQDFDAGLKAKMETAEGPSEE